MKLTSDLQLSGKQIKGWIIRYNQLSKPTKLSNGRLLFLRFRPGAFSASVQAINAGQAEFRLNVEHKTDNALMQLGSVKSNVVLEDRAEGVYVNIQLLDESVSDSIHAKLQTGAVGGFSLEADYPKTNEPNYEIDGQGNYIKSFDASIGLELTGAGIVANPRFPSSVAIAYSIEQSTEEIKKDEAKIEEIEKENKTLLETTVKEAVARSLAAALTIPESRNKDNLAEIETKSIESVETKEESGDELKKVIEERDNLQRQVSTLKMEKYDDLVLEILADDNAKGDLGISAKSESEDQ